jgi:hypothetical protein
LHFFQKETIRPVGGKEPTAGRAQLKQGINENAYITKCLIRILSSRWFFFNRLLSNIAAAAEGHTPARHHNTKLPPPPA